MELVGPRTTCKEIRKVYNEVYQLRRVPGVCPCDEEMVRNIYKEILNSVKEHLHCRHDHTQSMKEPGQRSTSSSRPFKLQQKVCAAYNHFWDLKEGSLAVAWDTHRWALATVALLKDKIERLSCSINHGCQ